MCLNLPARVVDVAPDRASAIVEAGRERRVVPLVVLGEEAARVATGDWLLLATGLAVARIDANEAAEMLELLEGARRNGP